MSRTTSLVLRAAAVVAGAIVIAACGSGSHHSTRVSSAGTVTVNGHPMSAAQANREMTRFASCMRSHGVPGMPDPTTNPYAFKQAFNTKSPAFQSAYTTCAHLQPGGGPPNQSQSPHTRRQIDAILAFARCMRGHGFSRFPDPTSGGSLTHQMLAQAGIDLHQPAVVRSADACTVVTHGVVTRAMVARFIAGQ